MRPALLRRACGGWPCAHVTVNGRSWDPIFRAVPPRLYSLIARRPCKTRAHLPAAIFLLPRRPQSARVQVREGPRPVDQMPATAQELFEAGELLGRLHAAGLVTRLGNANRCDVLCGIAAAGAVANSGGALSAANAAKQYAVSSKSVRKYLKALRVLPPTVGPAAQVQTHAPVPARASNRFGVLADAPEEGIGAGLRNHPPASGGGERMSKRQALIARKQHLSDLRAIAADTRERYADSLLSVLTHYSVTDWYC